MDSDKQLDTGNTAETTAPPTATSDQKEQEPRGDDGHETQPAKQQQQDGEECSPDEEGGAAEKSFSLEDEQEDGRRQTTAEESFKLVDDDEKVASNDGPQQNEERNSDEPVEKAEEEKEEPKSLPQYEPATAPAADENDAELGKSAQEQLEDSRWTQISDWEQSEVERTRSRLMQVYPADDRKSYKKLQRHVWGKQDLEYKPAQKQEDFDLQLTQSKAIASEHDLNSSSHASKLQQRRELRAQLEEMRARVAAYNEEMEGTEGGAQEGEDEDDGERGKSAEVASKQPKHGKPHRRSKRRGSAGADESNFRVEADRMHAHLISSEIEGMENVKRIERKKSPRQSGGALLGGLAGGAGSIMTRRAAGKRGMPGWMDHENYRPGDGPRMALLEKVPVMLQDKESRAEDSKKCNAILDKLAFAAGKHRAMKQQQQQQSYNDGESITSGGGGGHHHHATIGGISSIHGNNNNTTILGSNIHMTTTTTMRDDDPQNLSNTEPVTAFDTMIEQVGNRVTNAPSANPRFFPSSHKSYVVEDRKGAESAPLSDYDSSGRKRRKEVPDVCRTTQSLRAKKKILTMTFFDEYGAINGEKERIEALPPLKAGHGFVSPSRRQEATKKANEEGMVKLREYQQTQERKKQSRDHHSRGGGMMNTSVNNSASAVFTEGSTRGGAPTSSQQTKSGAGSGTGLSAGYSGPKHEIGKKYHAPLGQVTEKRIAELTAGVFVKSGNVSSYLRKMEREAKQGLLRPDERRSLKDRLGGAR